MQPESTFLLFKFCRAFTNYHLPLHALDVSSIYPSVSRCVAPPKSGEDAHVTCGIMGDLCGPQLGSILGHQVAPQSYGGSTIALDHVSGD